MGRGQKARSERAARRSGRAQRLMGPGPSARAVLGSRVGQGACAVWRVARHTDAVVESCADMAAKRPMLRGRTKAARVGAASRAHAVRSRGAQRERPRDRARRIPDRRSFPDFLDAAEFCCGGVWTPYWVLGRWSICWASAHCALQELLLCCRRTPYKCCVGSFIRLHVHACKLLLSGVFVGAYEKKTKTKTKRLWLYLYSIISVGRYPIDRTFTCRSA
jgi:hypothetical protein